MTNEARQGKKRSVVSKAGRFIVGSKTGRTRQRSSTVSESSEFVRGVTPEQAAAAARIQVTVDRKNGRKTEDWIVKLAAGL